MDGRVILPDGQWTRVLKAAVILIALVEAAALLPFGLFAMSGDELGIAGAMLRLLLGPFALTTVPALEVTAPQRTCRPQPTPGRSSS